MFHDLVSFVILAGLLKAILRKGTETQCLILLSSQRAEINVGYGTVPRTWSFLVSAAPGKKRTIVYLLTHFPLAVSLKPVTQFERILEQTESAELKSNISPYSVQPLHITGSVL